MGATPGNLPDDIGRRLDQIAAELAAEAKSGGSAAADRPHQPATGPGAGQAADQGADQGAGRPAGRAADRPAGLWSGSGLPFATQGGRPTERPWRRWRGHRVTARMRRRERPPGSDGPAARPATRPAGARRSPVATAVLVPVLVLVVLVGVGYALFRLHIESASAGTVGQPGLTQSDQPTSLVPAFTAADPFVGSPAESYADGSAGLTWPGPAAVGQFTAGQVLAAYQAVKQLLIAANLNKPTLEGAAPAAFAALLVPQQRAWFDQHLDHIGLTKAGKQRSSRSWVTSFAPGSASLVGSVIKVTGSMSAAAADFDARQVLQVRTDFLFVYPVQQPGEPDSRMRIVVRYIATVDFGNWDDAATGPLQPWISSQDGGVAGIRCGINDGFVHPYYPGGPPDSVQPSGRAYNPYNLRQPWPSATCAPTTGT